MRPWWNRQDIESLQLRLEELLSLYRQLVETCQTEQRRLAGELVQLNSRSRARRSTNCSPEFDCGEPSRTRFCLILIFLANTQEKSRH